MPRLIDRLMVLLLTVLSTALHAHADTPPVSTPLCKPQGYMRLAAPFGPPRNTGGLAFCREYDACSCCEHSHSGLIYNSLKAVLLDAGFSAQCKSYLSRLSCRVCDPQVGTGQRPAVCRHFCEGFHQACADEYFAFHPTSGALVPCTAEGQSALVCARAGELATSGRELCAAAGFAISDDAGRCWSGAGEAAVLDSCRAAAEPAAGKRGPLPAAPAAAAARKKADAAKKTAKKARKKAKSRSKKVAGAAYTTADILLLAAVGAVSLWAGWRLLTAAPLLRGGGPDSVRFPGASQKLGTAKIRQ